MNNKKDVLEISQDTLRKCIAGGLLTIFVVFVSGYYLGKKTAVESMMAEIEGNAFADKIYSSLCTLYPTWTQETEGTDSQVNQDDLDEQGENLPEIIDGSQDDTEELKIEESKEETKKESEPAAPRYYAQLIGYGSKKAAEKYKAKLQSRALDVALVERSAISSKGKKRTWYQIVTLPMEKSELEEVVDRVKKMDKLTDVHILEYREGTST